MILLCILIALQTRVKNGREFMNGSHDKLTGACNVSCH